MKRGEYLVFDTPQLNDDGDGDYGCEERLDKLGADGWELVGVVPTDDQENPKLLFKREKADAGTSERDE